jgi:hypothetical protein
VRVRQHHRDAHRAHRREACVYPGRVSIRGA